MQQSQILWWQNPYNNLPIASTLSLCKFVSYLLLNRSADFHRTLHGCYTSPRNHYRLFKMGVAMAGPQIFKKTCLKSKRWRCGSINWNNTKRLRHKMRRQRHLPTSFRPFLCCSAQFSLSQLSRPTEIIIKWNFLDLLSRLQNTANKAGNAHYWEYFDHTENQKVVLFWS